MTPTLSNEALFANIAHDEIKYETGVWFEEYGITMELGYVGNFTGPVCGDGDNRSWTIWVRNIKTKRGFMDLGYVSTENLPDLLERLTVEKLTDAIQRVLRSKTNDARFASVRGWNTEPVNSADESESIIRSFIDTFGETEA